jgi:hypothetical protein
MEAPMIQRPYVYIVRDPRPWRRKVPIYVGKGRKRRAEHKLGDPRKVGNAVLRAILLDCERPELSCQIEKIYYRDEASALRMEAALIAKCGRRVNATGTLWKRGG